jgi:hypothetical protein
MTAAICRQLSPSTPGAAWGCSFTLGATEEGIGAGRALLDDAAHRAGAAGCTRAWLVTTNDNANAIRFYQRQGWELVAKHRDAVTESRRLKPEIPERGYDDIPIRHELEFERRLSS